MIYSEEDVIIYSGTDPESDEPKSKGDEMLDQKIRGLLVAKSRDGQARTGDHNHAQQREGENYYDQP